MILLRPHLAISDRMAKPRLFVPGLSHHVWHRGNNKSDIYHDDEDRTVFLLLLGKAAQRSDVKIHSWTLMTSHYHALITGPDEQSVPRMMQRLGRNYVRYFNDRHKRTGTLWEGRYQASLVVDERYWLTCVRYIEMNPVAAKIVIRPEDYAWTSYRHHAFGNLDRLVVSHPLYDVLGDTAATRQAAWRAICGEALPPDDVALVTHALRTNGPLHGPGFVGNLRAPAA
jgi:putative transposase